MRDGDQPQPRFLAQLAACGLLGCFARLDESAGQSVDALAELHAKLVVERHAFALCVCEHHDDRIRAVLLQVRERVDVPVTADHLISARAAGAVNIMQVIAVQVCAAVFFFNVNELHGLLLFAGDSLAYHVLRRPTTKKIRAAPEAAAALIFFGGGRKKGHL